MSTVHSKFIKLILFIALTIGVNIVSLAATTSSNQQSTKPITGLVINQTNSFLAQNFYQAFCLAWHEHKGSDQFNITLKESHSARGGRQVKVIFDHQVAYTVSLPSGHFNVHSMATGAASYSFNQVQQLAIQNLALSSPDLAFDEI